MIKRFYGSSNKKAVEGEFGRQERRRTLLGRQHHLTQESEENDETDSSPLIHHFMTNKPRRDNVFSLPQLLYENRKDPATKVW